MHFAISSVVIPYNFKVISSQLLTYSLVVAILFSDGYGIGGGLQDRIASKFVYSRMAMKGNKMHNQGGF